MSVWHDSMVEALPVMAYIHKGPHTILGMICQGQPRSHDYWELQHSMWFYDVGCMYKFYDDFSVYRQNCLHFICNLLHLPTTMNFKPGVWCPCHHHEPCTTYCCKRKPPEQEESGAGERGWWLGIHIQEVIFPSGIKWGAEARAIMMSSVSPATLDLSRGLDFCLPNGEGGQAGAMCCGSADPPWLFA